jgi:hemoglobin-like flavoprotein
MGDMQRLLKESWTLVEDQQDQLAGYFYARMFLSRPVLRELFPATTDARRAPVLGPIVAAIKASDEKAGDEPKRGDRSSRAEDFDDRLRALGRDLRTICRQSECLTPPEICKVVGQAMIDSLRAFSGESWSIEYEQAWCDAYQAVMAEMAGGAIATQP